MATDVYGPSIVNALTISGFDLAVSSYIGTTNIDSEYVIDLLDLTFSSNASKIITLRNSSNTIIWSTGSTTDQTVSVILNHAMDYGDNVTLTISSTSPATDIVNGFLRVKPGAVLPVEYSIKQRLEEVLRKLDSGVTVTGIDLGDIDLSDITVGSVVVKPTYGSVVSIAPGTTSTVVQFSALGYKARGFSATGDGDGYFVLDVDGSTLLAGRIHTLEKNLNLHLDGSYPVEDGVTITLRVRNDAGVSCSYEATVLGE